MSLKSIIKDYFVFNRKERIGLVALLGIIVFITFLPKMFQKTSVVSKIVMDSTLINAIDTQQVSNQRAYLTDETDRSVTPEPSANTEKFSGGLFVFDPNTLETEGWKKLGLNDRIIKTINNYRNKGGRFYKKEDLKKIWGLPEAFYNRVESHISIATTKNSYQKSIYNNYQKPEKKISIVDINTSDTNAFIALPGIGSKLAARIVNFREKLGGFYSIDQVAETWGLNDSTFQLIKTYLQVKEGFTKRLNINQASKDDLKVHPYLKWKLASAIVDYRIRHGLYNSLVDLKNIPDIDEATFEKIRHYLTL